MNLMLKTLKKKGWEEKQRGTTMIAPYWNFNKRKRVWWGGRRPKRYVSLTIKSFPSAKLTIAVELREPHDRNGSFLGIASFRLKAENVNKEENHTDVRSRGASSYLCKHIETIVKRQKQISENFTVIKEVGKVLGIQTLKPTTKKNGQYTETFIPALSKHAPRIRIWCRAKKADLATEHRTYRNYMVRRNYAACGRIDMTSDNVVQEMAMKIARVVQQEEEDKRAESTTKLQEKINSLRDQIKSAQESILKARAEGRTGRVATILAQLNGEGEIRDGVALPAIFGDSQTRVLEL